MVEQAVDRHHVGQIRATCQKWARLGELGHSQVIHPFNVRGAGLNVRRRSDGLRAIHFAAGGGHFICILEQAEEKVPDR